MPINNIYECPHCHRKSEAFLWNHETQRRLEEKFSPIEKEDSLTIHFCPLCHMLSLMEDILKSTRK